VLQLFVQTYHRLLSAFWHFYNQCLFNSFRQVIWLECESKVSLNDGKAPHYDGKAPPVLYSRGDSVVGQDLTSILPCSETRVWTPGSWAKKPWDSNTYPLNRLSMSLPMEQDYPIQKFMFVNNVISASTSYTIGAITKDMLRNPKPLVWS